MRFCQEQLPLITKLNKNKVLKKQSQIKKTENINWSTSYLAESLCSLPSPAGSPRFSRCSDEAFCWLRTADGLMPFCCITCCSRSLSYFSDSISFYQCSNNNSLLDSASQQYIQSLECTQPAKQFARLNTCAWYFPTCRVRQKNTAFLQYFGNG